MKLPVNQQGFSLVETLVAITILLIVITGPMAISTSTARSTSYASEQVVAFFLAQEGAELAQKARDDILLNLFLDPFTDPAYNGTPWATFTNTSGDYQHCFGSDGCGLELEPDDSAGALKPVIDCAGGACQMYFNESGERDRYTYSATGNVQTLYTRVIDMQVLSPDEVRVVSKVTWRSGSLREAQEVVVETSLLNVY